MRNVEWTPGPWRRKTSGNLGNAIEACVGEWEYGERWSIVCTYQFALPNPASATMEEEDVNTDANGNLISAAPELYEALKACIEGEFACTNKDAVAVAEMAMAKARGES